MEKEKIIVIVPVYNVELYLERCIDSILNQTYKNFEILLINDGSSDKSPQICDNYADKYEKINVIHQENKGISVVRNEGILYARKVGCIDYTWITFVDSDDFIHPLYLEKLYLSVKRLKVDISSCGFMRTSESDIGDVDEEKIVCEIISPEEYWYKKHTNATVVWGKLYKLSCFDNIEYPVNKLFEDNFTTYRILFRYKKIAVIWIPLYYWFINRNSITQKQWIPRNMDVIDALQEQRIYFKNNGYLKACKPTVLSLYEHCIRQTMYLNALSPQYDYLIADMHMKRKMAFDLMREEYGTWKTLNQWFQIRILRPAKRVIESESVFSFLKRKIKILIYRYKKRSE